LENEFFRGTSAKFKTPCHKYACPVAAITPAAKSCPRPASRAAVPLNADAMSRLHRPPHYPDAGTGRVEHFSEVFAATDVEAALAAGIFHRREVPISAVKEHMRKMGIETR